MNDLEGLQKDIVLIFGHENYLNSLGGVQKVIYEQINGFLENTVGTIYIYPIEKKYNLIINNNDFGIMDSCTIMSTVKKIEYKLLSVIIHHVSGFHIYDTFFKYILKINLNFFYYYHDFSFICYNYVLLKNNKKFCGYGSPCLKKCIFCKFYLFSKFNLKKNQILMNQLENKVKFVFPSQFLQSVFDQFYCNKYSTLTLPLQKVEIHNSMDKNIGSKDNKRLKIAYVGYESRNKGWLEFVKFKNEFFQKYDFFAFGKNSKTENNITFVDVNYYSDGIDMEKALQCNNIDVAFLWSIWPETYSFTFFESYAAKCFVISNFSSGNIALMINKFNCGKVYNTLDEFFKEINDGQLSNMVTSYHSGDCIKIAANMDILQYIKGNQK